WRWCQRLGLSEVRVDINTVGDDDSRHAYRKVLQSFLRARRGGLCENCQRRIDTNPMRVLDCKQDAGSDLLAQAPDIMEVLTDASREHFDRVQTLLVDLAVPFQREPRLVRGLDYYTGTTFEFVSSGLGAQDAILGGGRYDNLVEQLGGPATPAIGFAAGVERLALLLEEQKSRNFAPDLYIIPMRGTEARALVLADELRARGPWRIEVDVSEGRLKRQMRRADRLGAQSALVLGEDELASGRGKLRHLGRSSEVDVDLGSEALHSALKELVAG
ncbi:histidine--tRNA ligase, partial [Myxococcota bacterium]